MSIECGECERDLRGGHSDDCSRKVPRCLVPIPGDSDDDRCYRRLPCAEHGAEEAAK